jgi:hypothetical protein
MSGAAGNATGMRVNMVAGQRDERAIAHVAELRAAAAAALEGKAPGGWVKGLLDRTVEVASEAAKAFVKPAAAALSAYLLSGN